MAISGFKSSGPQALRPLDAAVEMLRSHAGAIFPLYLAAVAPMSAVMFLLIDAVTASRYSALSEACALLAFATVWKWALATAAQARILERLSGKPCQPLRATLPAIVALRLAASVIMLWGSMVILPFIYGFILSGLAGPALLDRGGKAVDTFHWALKWTGESMAAALKIVSTLTILAGVAYLGFSLIQLMVTELVMPSFLGVDPSELSFTLYSSPWRIASAYFIFLVFDFYWMAASVSLYYEIQSRRVGVDLGARLSALEGR